MADLSGRIQNALATRYRVERELGRGGMASVWLAVDLRQHRRVAIKVLDPEVAAAVGPERFLREIETVANLAHPHILALHDSGTADGLFYYVMPYVAGESLRARLEREGQLPVEDAMRIAREVAEALGHAHEQGIVHRDVKPENVLLEAGQAVVADFGIARAAAGGKRLTATGVAVGTPAYMSPEQAAGERKLDGRSDQYSLACVVYEMLAGQPPFTGPTTESVVHQHLHVAPRPVTELRPTVPTGVAGAVMRALAKAPADRFASTLAFSAALERSETMPVPRPSRRWVAPAAGVMVVVAALAAVAAWQQRWPFGERLGPVAKKDWILVAEFDSAPEDTSVAMASHDLLSAALDQSRIVATVPRDQVGQALRAAGKPANARVDAELARELAYRSAVRAVLEGRVGRLGPAYTIVLRLVDADAARVILTESGVAKDRDALVPTLANLARRLRAGLGEQRAALRATRSMALVMTPSFEAYQLYVQGRRAVGQWARRRALNLFRAAIALDPDFASAWAAMSDMYFYRSIPDSSWLCLEEALRRPERLTPRQRQELEASRVEQMGDFRGALAICNQVLADNPNDTGALGMSVDLLQGLGRFEEALECSRKAMKLSPFGPGEVRRIEIAWMLTELGRFDEARAANDSLRYTFRVRQRSWIEASAGRWAVAESIATAHANDAELNEDNPGNLQWRAGNAQFARGALDASATSLERAERTARDASDPSGDLFRRSRLEFAVVSGRLFPVPPARGDRDTSITMLLTRGLHATTAVDLPIARRCLALALSRPRQQLAQQGAAAELLEARIATLAGRPADAVRQLRPIAVERVEPGWSTYPVGLTWVRWSLADAYERLGQRDSAAVALERITSEPCHNADWAFVHHRLARLYAGMGRLPEAERHLAALEQTWDKPDPAARRLLEETRAAVRAARGVARPERAAN